MNAEPTETSASSAPSAAQAALAYTVLSLLLTWPLVRGLGSDVPGDLGDSLLNMWILAWGAEHVPSLLTMQMSWGEYWNGNIFAPDSHALALSEHLFGQTLQILPVYWLTGNIILCYNLLFISTFALSGFGTYLLVRDLTGDRRAAFIAGLVYGFLPYRIASVPHLQVMSSQWMPFALWGLNRFVTLMSAPGSRLSAYAAGWPLRRDHAEPRSASEGGPAPGSKLPDWRALALGVGALVMQNWSCAYYLLYFAPFVPLFVVFRMWTSGTLRNVRVWGGLVAAGVVTLALTLPFLLPYQEVARLFAIERPFGEVVSFSANVWSYVTASENLRLFGKALRFYPHGEGETFLGFTPWLLAAIALIAAIWESRTGFGNADSVASGFSRIDKRIDKNDRDPVSIPLKRDTTVRIATWILAILAITQFLALLSAVIFGGFDIDLLGIPIRARTPQRLLFQFVAVSGLLLAVSQRMRAVASRLVRSPIAFFFALTVLAMWLSLGPVPRAGDSMVSGFGIYGVLYENVPGFNGVRVPARYAMIAGLFLAILAGYGARFLTFRFSFFVAAILILAEGLAIPMELNRTWNQNQAMPPARVLPREEAPAVYKRVAALPESSIVTEFPFGDAAWEIRYVYYAAVHWKPITNGYSGAFPPRYKERVARLQRVDADPEGAWQNLRESGTTHVVLHRNAFAKSEDADAVESWLKSHGAIELERFAEGDILLSVPVS